MSGEYEPNDSRNVTGTAATPDGRWTAQGQQPPEANGQSPRPSGQQDRPTAQGGGGMTGGGLSEGDNAAPGSEQIGSETGAGATIPDGTSGGEGFGGGSRNDAGSEAGMGQSRGQDGMENSGTEDAQAGMGQLNTNPAQAQMGQAIDGGWPDQMQQGSGQQAGSLSEQIREHMAVVDAEGTQVGTVDGFENDQIKLTRSDSPDGQHHYLPIDRVAGIEGDTVRLHQSGEGVFGSNGS